MYFSTEQAPFFLETFMLRTAAPLAAVEPGARQALREIAPTIPWPGLQPLSGNLDAALAPQRFTAWLLVAFSGVAVVLAAVGIYGIVAFSVAQRTSEIGVRIALGALPRQVMRSVLRDSVVLTLAGLVVGAVGAAALSRTLAALLFQTPTTDWPTYMIVASVLLVVTAMASWFPARRAARIDPLEALRAS
jgi:putative ABC transport system permease protein